MAMTSMHRHLHISRYAVKLCWSYHHTNAKPRYEYRCFTLLYQPFEGALLVALVDI
jgi:hypothetical protein